MKKTIIISGAAGNLGKTITSQLLKEGYHIHATLGPHDDPNYIKDKNLESEVVSLTDANESRLYINKIINKKEEDIICLVCLVGGFTQGTIETTSIEDIQKMVNINFATTYNLVKPLIAHCKEKKRPLQIIFVGSRPAIIPEEGKEYIAYALSKSLLFKLADFINVDSNNNNIQTSVIVPSTMDTSGTRAAMPEIDPSLWIPTENVANTISFILSDSGKMMRSPIYKLYNYS